MKVKLKEFEPSIDFCEFMRDLDKKYNFKHRDMSNAFGPESAEERKIKIEKWLEKNGYDGLGYVLDLPQDSSSDWPEGSEEMRLRIEINTKLRDVDDLDRPYEDFWHWLLDNDFSEIHNGSFVQLELHDERLKDPDIPEYVKKVMKAIHTEVKDSDAYDEEFVNFYVIW